MSQTLKPDRPIWPSVPETAAPPEPKARNAEPAKRDSIPVDRSMSETATIKPSAFEGFGSFSG